MDVKKELLKQLDEVERELFRCYSDDKEAKAILHLAKVHILTALQKYEDK